MDIPVKLHSYEAVALANDRYAAKIGLLGMMQYLIISLRSTVRSHVVAAF
jgi:hypothetical protein